MNARDLLGWIGIHGNPVKDLFLRSATAAWFLAPYYSAAQRRAIVRTGDPVRFGTVALAIERLLKEGIEGSLAECGVYRGAVSRYLHESLPDRTLYLFDTFQGFDGRDSDTFADDRFKDTSVEAVMAHIGDPRNVRIRKGYFPETAAGLEGERFAFVMIDFDKYEPTVEALEFFYPRVNPGGFIFVHDYNSPESNRACSRALDGFLADKPEKPVAIPDGWGTALFRKV